MKHTPGPWRIIESTVGPHPQWDILSDNINTGSVPILIRRVAIVHGEANAYIIAATPELLSTGKAMLKLYRQELIEEHSVHPGKGDREYFALKTAVLKAENQENI